MKIIEIVFIIIIYNLTLSGQSTPPQNQISIGEIIKIKSEILNEEREIFVYQPQGFWGMDEQIKNLPVIYVLDGESQFLQTVSTVDYLSAAPYGNDVIPRSIVVGIPNTNRDRDLTPIKGILGNDSTTLKITGGGPNFLNFICEEIIPYIDSSFNTSAHRTIIGHSLGGLLAFEALLRKRDYFDNYICIDPAFGFANEKYMIEVMDSLKHADLKSENLYFTAANNRPSFLSEEELFNDESDFMSICDIPNKKFITSLDSNQYQININYKYYPDENHFSVPYRSTYDALKKIYHYYSFPEILDYYHPKYKNKTDLIERLERHYKVISSKMGYEAIPMEGYINSFAFGIAPSGREDLAIALFEYNIKLNPSNPIVYNNLAYFYKSKGKYSKAIELFKQSHKLLEDFIILTMINELEVEISGK